MTRSHKQNDRDHAGLADGSAEHAEQLPRYFAKHGFTDADPKKTKKDGGGKANWGREGDELEDYSYNMTNPRRRSNSTGLHTMKDFKTKFETIEPEPVFEEEIHGPLAENNNNELEKMSSGGSSNSEGSVEEEHAAKKL